MFDSLCNERKATEVVRVIKNPLIIIELYEVFYTFVFQRISLKLCVNNAEVYNKLSNNRKVHPIE